MIIFVKTAYCEKAHNETTGLYTMSLLNTDKGGNCEYKNE